MESTQEPTVPSGSFDEALQAAARAIRVNHTDDPDQQKRFARWWDNGDAPPEIYAEARRQAMAALDAANLGEARRLLALALHLRMYGECAPGGHETWAQFDTDLEHYLRGLPRPEPLRHNCKWAMPS